MALSDILGGLGGGALTGFGIGGGPIGAIAGGLLGALGGSLSGTKADPFTKPDQLQKFDIYTPDQQNLLAQINAILSGNGNIPQRGLLGQLFGEEGFNAYAQPAIRAYEEQIVPKLAERFTGAGAQRSSAFQNVLAQSGQELARSLGEMRGQQQQNLLGSLLGPALGQQFHQYYTPPSPSGFSQLLAGLGGGLGKAGGSLLAGLLQNRLGGTT